MSNRNRDAGNQFERDTIIRLKDSGLFPNAVSSRSESRNRDAQKVDVMNSDEHKNGRMPYNIQCKNYSKSLIYSTLLGELPQDHGIMNVIFHKQTKKVGTRFMTQGTYAILSLDDFYEMMRTRAGFELLYSQATEEQKSQLAHLGL